MTKLPDGELRRLKGRYRLDVAKFIAAASIEGREITYGDLEAQSGGVARGFGDVLSGIALRCREKGLPLLSVLVVNKQTRRPSVDAKVYESLGLVGDDEIDAEMERCRRFVWSLTPLGQGP